MFSSCMVVSTGLALQCNANSKPGGGSRKQVAPEDLCNYTLNMPAPGKAYKQQIFLCMSGPYLLGGIQQAYKARILGGVSEGAGCASKQG